MRENVYLVAALALAGIFLIIVIKKRLLPRVGPERVLVWAGHTLSAAMLFALVIVFLRPISQFIYFQF